MRRHRHPLGVLILLLTLLAAACSSSDASDTDGSGGNAGGTTSNEIAPIFSVTTQEGEFSLSEHLANDGRPVFLNLWASWCFPCREEMPAIDRSSAAHPEVAFLGVAVQDTASEAAAFADEIGVTYMLAFDEDGTVESGYKPLGLPASYIISGDGVIVERIFGKVTEEDLDAKLEEHFG